MALPKAGGLPNTPPRTYANARRKAQDEEDGAVGDSDHGTIPKMYLHKIQKLDYGPIVKGRNYQQGMQTEIVGGEVHANGDVRVDDDNQCARCG